MSTCTVPHVLLCGCWQSGVRPHVCRHGRGEMHLKNDVVFMGTWIANERQEEDGQFVFPNGDVYSGLEPAGIPWLAVHASACAWQHWAPAPTPWRPKAEAKPKAPAPTPAHPCVPMPPWGSP